MNQTTIIIALVLAVSSFTAGVKVTSWKHDSELLQVAQDNEELRLKEGQEAADLIQEALDAKTIYKTKWRTKYKTKLIKIDSNNDCRLNDDSLLVWNEAISDAATKASITNAAMHPLGAPD